MHSEQECVAEGCDGAQRTCCRMFRGELTAAERRAFRNEHAGERFRVFCPIDVRGALSADVKPL
jgi:hypothetical protein